jgi:TolA-binding protein
MLKPPSALRSKTVLITALGVVLIAGTTTVVAQNTPMEPVQWDKRRLDQLDRNVRRLERAVTQRNAAGQPVLVEPDPEVIALQGRFGIIDRRVDDMEATVQRVNADLERLTFQLDEATRDNAALGTRLRDAEGRIEAMEEAAAAASAAAREAAERAEASPTGDAAGDLAAARAMTDPRQGAAALERVVVAWPSTPQAREAEWRLGDIQRAGGDHPASIQSYARALRDWPREPWAGEVTLKLARGLLATDNPRGACAAVDEFDRRYETSASQALRTIARQVREQAECG